MLENGHESGKRFSRRKDVNELEGHMNKIRQAKAMFRNDSPKLDKQENRQEAKTM